MWFKIHNHQVTLCIFAKPHAKQTVLLKVDNDGLHITLHAKPHEGEANKELISYLAKLFRLPKSHVNLQQGEHSRQKVVRVPLTHKVQQFLNDPTRFYTQ
ncbi:MAG: hypothetical protein ACD_46C00523G0009 [uncultured bacterium]|nr:MAG: hypothetical protein ACD_46C00523G0009 [uncultured bacterium]